MGILIVEVVWAVASLVEVKPSAVAAEVPRKFLRACKSDRYIIHPWFTVVAGSDGIGSF